MQMVSTAVTTELETIDILIIFLKAIRTNTKKGNSTFAVNV